MHIFDLKIFLLWIGMTLTHQGPIKPAMKSWPPKQILLKKELLAATTSRRHHHTGL